MDTNFFSIQWRAVGRAQRQAACGRIRMQMRRPTTSCARVAESLNYEPPASGTRRGPAQSEDGALDARKEVVQIPSAAAQRAPSPAEVGRPSDGHPRW
jgi:hypothetical protein